MKRVESSRCRADVDLEAEILQAPQEAAGERGPVATDEVIGAEVAVRDVAAENGSRQQ